MKYLIVGLGNIGNEYENTRHNIGFKIVDYFNNLLLGSFKSVQFGSISKCYYKNNKIIILKPNTYINLSGEAIVYWLHREKILLKNLLILVDDLYLPFGKIKINKKGGSSGHNGLKNIEQKLSTQEYSRLRFGIGNYFEKGEQINYVLSNWNKEEEKILCKKINFAIYVIKYYILSGIEKSMSLFNKK